MSYILDALKKSEAEADPDAAARISLNQSIERRNRTLVYVACGALLLNGVLIGGWLLSSMGSNAPSVARIEEPAAAVQRETPRQAPPASTAGDSVGNSAANDAANSVANADPQPQFGVPQLSQGSRVSRPLPLPEETLAAAPAPQTIDRRRAAATQPAAARAPDPIPLPRRRYNDLSDAKRQRFPGLAFSTHIYAPEPEFRAVVVNGKRVTAGSRVQGIQLVEITESGAVFEFEGEWVEIPVLLEWEQ